MRNAIIGIIVGLIIGGAVAYAIAYHPDLSKQMAKLQADLSAAQDSIAKLTRENKDLNSRVKILSDQNEQLSSGNKPADGGTATASTSPAGPNINAGMIAGVLRGAVGRGNNQQRILLLSTRLHLTPDQQKAVQAAMEAEARGRMDALRQRFRNNGGAAADGTAAPATPAAPVQTLDQALATILTPTQQTAYQQLQSDEKTTQANTAATVQLNQVAPLLQLSDTQKSQMYDALYQIQVNAPDPTTLISNPNATSVLSEQSKATTDALARILTPEQMALYQQQNQAVTAGGFGGGGGGGNNGGGAGGNGGGRRGRNQQGAATGGGAATTPAPATAPASGA